MTHWAWLAIAIAAAAVAHVVLASRPLRGDTAAIAVLGVVVCLHLHDHGRRNIR